MKSYRATSGAGLEGLIVREHDEPAPGAREVLVRVRANSLNFREISVMRGTYPLPVKPARRLQAGDTVLTLGSGSVSLFALQLARLFGARVIATTSSDAKAERLRSLGADVVVNYTTAPDWHRAVRALTGGRGVDQVIEIGGSTLEQSIRATAIEGLINFVGRLGDGPMTLDGNLLYASIATIRVVAAGSRAQFDAMNRAITVAGLRPVIDRVFPFDDVPAAFRYLEASQPLGKVVISHG